MPESWAVRGGARHTEFQYKAMLTSSVDQVIKKLGVGHFSCVYLCWDNE